MKYKLTAQIRQLIPGTKFTFRKRRCLHYFYRNKEEYNTLYTFIEDYGTFIIYRDEEHNFYETKKLNQLVKVYY